MEKVTARLLDKTRIRHS